MTPYEEYIELEEKLPIAESNLCQLTHYRKVVLAQEMQKAMNHGHTTVAAQEREARASIDYQNVIMALAEATGEKWRLFFKMRRLQHELGW